MPKPNVVFLFADQWRAQSVGYMDKQVKTPRIDTFARESLSFTNAISTCPICTPYRASLLTGQYPLTHGLFMNDLCMDVNTPKLGDIFKRAGYDTAWVGKWHADGHGRKAYIPPERRGGFEYWKALECSHDYERSLYYAGDEREPRMWEGYDAIAQTRDAAGFLESRRGDKPFLLAVSWGPPHNSYEIVPEKYRAMYEPAEIRLPPNVPPECEAQARRDLQGYFAHISALDDCVGEILDSLEGLGLAENTVFVLTSDHGDCVWSHCTPETGNVNKQRPYEESIHVPFLLRAPGMETGESDALLAPQDILPTLCGLCGVPCPDTVEGRDVFAGPPREGALLAGYVPFCDWGPKRGGFPYRGIRTGRYMYAERHDGPWLLYNILDDPYELHNLVGDAALAEELRGLMVELMEEQGDRFETGEELCERFGYHSLTGGNEIPLEKGEEWYGRKDSLRRRDRFS